MHKGKIFVGKEIVMDLWILIVNEAKLQLNLVRSRIA